MLLLSSVRSRSSSLLLFGKSPPFIVNPEYFCRIFVSTSLPMGPKKKAVVTDKKLLASQRQELARRTAILKRMVHQEDESEESSVSASEESSDEAPQIQPAAKKAKLTEAIFNPTSLNLEFVEDFACDAKNEAGEPYNLKISSWNVNGMRAITNKGMLQKFLKFERPDILCVQETKCSEIQLPETAKFEEYTGYWLAGDTKGYSGVGIYTKVIPHNVKFGIGDPEHDKEGRVITAEYEKFTLVTAYVPNSGRKLVRLEYRKTWDVAFRSYIKELEEIKPVILCGDLNVAHQKIDLAKPKTNTKNAGFTTEEREGFTALLNEGFVDSFRVLHPNAVGAYTFWTFMMSARAKDIGWRLDYFVVSKQLMPNMCDSLIRKNVLGSDHCPITLVMTL